MLPSLELVKIGLSLLFLSYASWQDYKHRVVSNKVWVLFAPLGFTLTLLHIFLSEQGYIPLIISFFALSGISVALFYFRVFGGADAKALICVSLTFPFGPTLFQPHYRGTIRLFSLSIFSNAVLASALSVVGIVVYNVLWRVRTGERFFDGLEHESPWNKCLALITGYKIDSSQIREKPHIVPIEEISEEEDGRVIRHLRVFVRVDDDLGTNRAHLTSLSEKLGKIWVTPSLPFIIFITIGLITTFLVGDLILLLATRLF